MGKTTVDFFSKSWPSYFEEEQAVWNFVEGRGSYEKRTVNDVNHYFAFYL